MKKCYEKKLMLLGCIFLTIFLCNGCAVQYGIYSLKDDGIKNAMEHNGYLAGDLFSSPFWHNKVDANFGLGYLKGPKYGEGQLKTYVDLYDINCMLHFYPLGAFNDNIFIRPYIGAGVGYYDLSVTRESKGNRVGGENYVNFYIDYYEINSDTKSIVKGFYPDFVLGFIAPISRADNLEFVVEDNIETSKSKKGLNFSGNILLFGIRWNPWN